MDEDFGYSAQQEEIRRELDRMAAEAHARRVEEKRRVDRELVVNRVELLVVLPVSLVSMLASADRVVAGCAVLLILQPLFYCGGLQKIEYLTGYAVMLTMAKLGAYAGLSAVILVAGGERLPHAADLIAAWEMMTTERQLPLGDTEASSVVLGVIFAAGYATVMAHLVLRCLSAVGYEDEIAEFRNKGA